MDITESMVAARDLSSVSMKDEALADGVNEIIRLRGNFGSSIKESSMTKTPPIYEPTRDIIGRAIYEETDRNGDTPDWYKLSEAKREPWRTDADRVVKVTNELIANQQIEIESYKERLENANKSRESAWAVMACIGGPLNDNRLQYTQEQRKELRKIEPYLADSF